jgi:hypothetical protein
VVRRLPIPLHGQVLIGNDAVAGFIHVT